MTKRMIAMLIACAVVFGGVFGFKWFGTRMMNRFFDTMPEPPVTVSTTKVYLDTWRSSLEAVGTLRAVRGTDVTTEAAGIVESIEFESSDTVAAGAILVTLDRATDRAELDALVARAELAAQELERARELAQRGAISNAELDRRAAEAAAAYADVAAQRARIAQKVIRAPFGGVLGIRRVDLGQYLSPGTAIVNLQSLDPIHVNFKLPQQFLGKIRTGLTVTLAVEAFAGRHFKGRITAIEPLVEVSTRNFEAQATLDNADHLLRPGMFAQVQIDLGEDETAVVVPQTAISYNPYGDSVWVLKAPGSEAHREPQGSEARDREPQGSEARDGRSAARDQRDADRADPDATFTAERRIVQLGRRRGDLVQVLDGLKPGEQIATSGLLKLRRGVPVVINNDVQPSAETAPTPPNS